MLVYSAEAGIADKIRSENKIAYHMQLSFAKEQPQDKESIRAFAKSQFGNDNLNDEDLCYLESILASVGYNLNDDLFTKEDMWMVKNSPIHKQFNYGHNQRDIIGHIYASEVVDVNGKVIADETPFDDVPDFFDIRVKSVLYKVWQQPEDEERITKVIAEMAEGKWFVSMEAFFKSFDYALVHANNEVEIIKREKATAHMSQYLRFYGGQGEYKGKPIKRVLRRFSFNGKGLVEQPANPRSVIFNDINRHSFYSSANIIEQKEKIMEIQAKDFEEVKAKLTVAESALSVAQTALAKAQEDNKKLSDELSLAAKSNVDLKSDLAKAQEEAKAEKLKNLTTERVSVLVQAGVKIDEAKTIADKWKNVDATLFADIVTLHTKAAMSDESAEEEKKKKADEEAKAKLAAEAEAKAKKDAEEEAVKAAQASLNKNDVTDKTKGAPAVNTDVDEKNLTLASQWFQDSLTPVKGKKKDKGE